jgi:hypothetical protein
MRSMNRLSRCLAGTLLLLALAARDVPAEQVQPAPARELDDLTLHLLAGMAGSLGAAAAAYPFYSSAPPNEAAPRLAAVGVSASALLGMLKELLDALGFGTPDWSDLAATLVGGLAGGLLVYTAERASPHAGSHSAALPALFGSVAFVLSWPVAESLAHRLTAHRRAAAEGETPAVAPPTPSSESRS